jgi:glycosyltransferase involved in cell wall biosynthesis
VKVVYVLGDVPVAGTGAQARCASVAAAMARVADELVIAYPMRGDLQPDARLRELPATRLLPVAGGRARTRLAQAAGQLARGRPLGLARSYKRPLRLAAAAAAERADVVVADRLAAAAAVLDAGIRDRVATRYCAHNIEWTLRRDTGTAERIRWAGTRRLERRVLSAFDESWMVSDADCSSSRELVPDAALRRVPNALDVSRMAMLEPTREPVVLFVGSFDYEPNREALAFLADEVMPRVWPVVPEARLHVIGRWPGEPWRPRDERLLVHGFVPDVAAAYANARCAVAPLTTSGGTPLKIVEALAYGLPVVATEQAMRGLPDLRAAVHVADGAEALARALARVLRPAYEHATAAEGRRLVERGYSVEALVGAVGESLSKAASTSSRKTSVASK